MTGFFFSREVPAPAIAGAAPTDREASRSTVAQLLRTYCGQRSDSIGETLLLQVLLHVSSYCELPLSGATIRQRLQSGSEQTPTDGILSYCIALIQSILAQNAVPAVGGDSSQCTPVLRALACTLKVFHCHVMSHRGLLVPTRLAEPLAVIAQLVDVVASDRWKNWCRAVLQFGEQRVSADAQTAAGEPDESIRGKVLQDPMAGPCEPLRHG
ncbi:MAG: hypothetical protein IPN24_00205 [Betaproteobacteria bacterium]|nr:hypothetical protein [Betaproteobacteria bacterium]